MKKSTIRGFFTSPIFLMVFAAIAVAGFDASAQVRTSAKDLNPTERKIRAEKDLVRLKAYETAVERIRGELTKLTPALNATAGLPDAQVRHDVREIFAEVLAYGANLEEMGRFHEGFLWMNPLKPATQARHFLLAYAARLASLDLALHFIELTIDKPQFETLLDAGDPEYGIPKDAYAGLKYAYIHIGDLSRFIAMRQLHKVMRGVHYKRLKTDAVAKHCRGSIARRYKTLKQQFLYKSAGALAGNAWDMLKDGTLRTVFPVQAGVAEWMGDTKVQRQEEFLIDQAQISTATNLTAPGDILVERRNWYLSNVGLPGFWPHTALYIGTSEELTAFFDQDADTTAYFGMRFSKYLQKKFPATWKQFSTSKDHGHRIRIIEAMSEGVVFTSAEYSLHADYAAALRPRLSKANKAIAIATSFSYFGRPYDFDFDFYSDASLVCSELVFKSYEDPEHGLHLALDDVLGRKTLPVNRIVKQYDEEKKAGKQQFDFVWFLDASETRKAAFFSSEKEFRNSHQRPRWDIVQP